MQLPKEKTKPVFDMAHLTALIYGIPKVGKSTFCAGAEDALFVSTEPGLNHLECYETPVTNWMEFLEVCKELTTKEHDYKTVIIDTIDNLFQLCSTYVLEIWSEKTGKQIIHEGDLGHGKGWALVRTEFNRVMTQITMFQFGVVFISHAIDRELETRTGTICKTFPSMPNQANKVISPLVDLILFFEMDKDQNRIIHTKPHTNYEAGDRTGRLPDKLLMNWDVFEKALIKGNPKEKPSKQEKK